MALDGKKFEAFLQADGSVEVVVGDFRGTFADIYDALGGREEVRKDLRSRQLSHTEISDAESLVGVDFSGLENPYDVGGIGGTMKMYSAPAAVCLSDGSNERSFDVLIGIPEEVKDDGDCHKDMPSLLGRDIINQSVMVYDSPRRKLEFPLPPSEKLLT